MDQHTITTALRAIKGPATSILLALILYRRPLGTTDLATITGYAPNSITAGLRVLRSVGFAENHNRYNGWQLTARVRQLPFWGESQNLGLESQNLRLPDHATGSPPPRESQKMGLESQKLRLPEAAADPPQPGESQPLGLESQNLRLDPSKVPRPEGESQKMRLESQNLGLESQKLRFPTATTTAVNNKDLKKDTAEEAGAGDRKKIAASGEGAASCDSSASRDSTATREALKGYGIGNPVRNLLARRPEITPAHVHGHAAQLKQQNRFTAGLLICCLKDISPGDAPPEVAPATREAYFEQLAKKLAAGEPPAR